MDCGSVHALHAIDIKAPDLVVLDLALPRLNGHSVLEELRARASTHHIPVMLVTASTSAEIYELGADCVLTKPLTPDRFVEAVRDCLSGSKAK